MRFQIHESCWNRGRPRSRLTRDMHKLKERLFTDFVAFQRIETLKHKLLDSTIVLVNEALNSFAELVKFLLRNEVIEKLAELNEHHIPKLLVVAVSQLVFESLTGKSVAACKFEKVCAQVCIVPGKLEICPHLSGVQFYLSRDFLLRLLFVR